MIDPTDDPTPPVAMAALEDAIPQASTPVATSLLAEIADEANPLSAFGAEPEPRAAEPEPEAFSSEIPGNESPTATPIVDSPPAASNRRLLFGIAAAMTLGALVSVWLLLSPATPADSAATVGTDPEASITDTTALPAPVDSPADAADVTGTDIGDTATAESTPVVSAPPAPPDPTPAVEKAVIPPSTPGSLTVKVPALLRVLEQGRLVGMTDAERITLPPGRHTLVFESDELGFRVERRVTIKPGENTALSVELPEAPLAINAQPWADVWVDDERVGETPIGNLTRSIGPHDIVFRHPNLGERRVSVLVTLKEPARVSVDLRDGN